VVIPKMYKANFFVLLCYISSILLSRRWVESFYLFLLLFPSLPKKELNLSTYRHTKSIQYPFFIPPFALTNLRKWHGCSSI